jgi:hypothetical protein
MPAELRTCGRCGALAVPESAVTVVVVSAVPVEGTSLVFRCSGCSLRFRVAPMFALVLLGVSVAMFLGLIALAPMMWWFFAGLAAAPLAALLHGVHVRRRHRRADPETAALLARALGDERIQALLGRAAASRES